VKDTRKRITGGKKEKKRSAFHHDRRVFSSSCSIVRGVRLARFRFFFRRRNGAGRRRRLVAARSRSLMTDGGRVAPGPDPVAGVRRSPGPFINGGGDPTARRTHARAFVRTGCRLRLRHSLSLSLSTSSCVLCGRARPRTHNAYTGTGTVLDHRTISRTIYNTNKWASPKASRRALSREVLSSRPSIGSGSRDSHNPYSYMDSTRVSRRLDRHMTNC